MYPFPISDDVVVMVCKQRVVFKTGLYPVGPSVGFRVTFFCKPSVLCHGVIHLIEIGACIHREEYQLIKRIFIGGRNKIVEAHSVDDQITVIIHHPFKLIVVIQAVDGVIQQLGCNTTVIFGVKIDQPGRLIRIFFTKLLGTPSLGMYQQVRGVELVWVPCHVEKERDGIFHRFQVSHIHHPYPVHAVAVGEVHLLPHPLHLRDIDPFIIPGSTHIVKMIVHPVAAGTFRRVGEGQLPYITPVVVAQQQCHIVRHPHTLVVIVLYLLVEGPHLGCLLRFLAGHLRYDLPLILNDLLEQRDVTLLTHRLVTISTHAHGNQCLTRFHPLHALFPEITQCRFVGLVVPVTTPITAPFIVGPSHGFVMGGAYNNAHLVGKLPVHRVIIKKGVAPHGWPDEVPFQSQDQLKYLLIEQVVESTEGFLSPSAQGGGFIVEEDTSVFYGRLPIRKKSLADADRCPLVDRHVGPPVPWRYAHLL